MKGTRPSENAHPPFAVTVDSPRKLLRVQFRATVTARDAADHVAEVERALRVLKPGFTLLTDLTGLEGMELDCVPHITRAMDLCLAAGVAKVVRIIPDPRKDIGFTLLSLVHYRGRVPMITCETREEAELELSRA
jgi:hypothetical protein